MVKWRLLWSACCSFPVREDLVAVAVIIPVWQRSSAFQQFFDKGATLEANPLLDEPATASGQRVEDDGVVGTAEPNLQDDSAIRAAQIYDGVDGRCKAATLHTHNYY